MVIGWSQGSRGSTEHCLINGPAYRDMMARVKIRMFATVREAAGTAEAELDAANLAEVLDRLGRMYGKPFAAILRGFPNDPERLVVLVNGRNVYGREARATALKEGDEVSIFPPVSGG